MSVFKSRFATVFVAATVLVGFSSLSAVGSSMITSAKIKNNTIRSIDVRNGTLGLRDMNATARSAIENRGPQASAGLPATPRYVGPNWSIVDRNVIGNGDSYLRSGPDNPPAGVGSLGIRTGSATDRAAFGDQADFVGKTLASLTTLKYSVYATGEDLQTSPNNAPNLQFEINPSDGAHTYSTLTFVPTGVLANQWTELDATTAKQWYLTGATGTSTGCNQNTYCTLAEVKQALPNATLYTAQISKGRDWAFSGAVDKLVINSTMYDFEPVGVSSN